MKLFLLLTTLAAVALADPYYYGYYGHQLQWPGVRAPGFSSTCWGCRGKRSADAEPEAKPEAEAEPYYGYGHYGYGYHPYAYRFGPGIAGHVGGGTSYTHRSPQGIGKRSAEEEAAPEHAYGLHPSGGKSYVGNTVWRARGKRSAEPEPHYGYCGYPGYGYHGYGARSFVGRTVWGLGK